MSVKQTVLSEHTTRGQLNMFKHNLKRVYPLDESPCFEDLLHALDGEEDEEHRGR